MKPLLIFRLLLLLATGIAAATPTRCAADEQLTAAAVGPAAAEATPSPAPIPPTDSGAQAAPRQVAAETPQAPPIPALSATPAAPTAPASSAPSGPSDLVRRRCKIAGAVLLGLAGATVIAFFGSLIYSAVQSPDSVSLPAGPRLGFGLSALALGISGSALVGYSINATGRPAPPRTLAPAPNPPRASSFDPALLPAAASSAQPTAGRLAALELRF